jgi:hypothetical protein
MNFEIGEVVSRALQITWKNKSFWGFVFLPMLINFLAIPLSFAPLIFLGDNPSGAPSFLENPIFLVLFIILHIIIALVSFVLMTYGYASLTLGIVRAERGEADITFKGLLQDSKKYFPRMLGVMLLTYVGISFVFFVIFGCLILFGFVTAGIGFICIQPLIIVLYPVMMILYAFMEQSQAAVIADEMEVMQAINKGWELLKAYFWRLVLISLVIYLGIGIVSSFVVMPFMLPFFFFPFLFESNNFDPQTFGLAMGGFMLLLLPVMALVQGVTITFMKSAYVLVYLRLTRTSNMPMAVETGA